MRGRAADGHDSFLLAGAGPTCRCGGTAAGVARGQDGGAQRSVISVMSAVDEEAFRSRSSVVVTRSRRRRAAGRARRPCAVRRCRAARAGPPIGPAQVDEPHHDVVALEDGAARDRSWPGRPRPSSSWLGEQPGQRRAAARPWPGRTARAGAGPPARAGAAGHVVHGRERGPGEEVPAESGSLRSRSSSRYGLMASSTARTSGWRATWRSAASRSPSTSTARTTRLPCMNSEVRRSRVVSSTRACGRRRSRPGSSRPSPRCPA